MSGPAKIDLSVLGLPDDAAHRLSAGSIVIADADELRGWLTTAFRAGRAEAGEQLLTQAAELVAAAQKVRDQAEADRCGMRARLRRLSMLETGARAFHAVVADCQQWFNGFAAAHAGRESWEQPRIPDPQRLRDLNVALMSVNPAPAPEDEMPF